jgi:outer membrane protein
MRWTKPRISLKRWEIKIPFLLLLRILKQRTVKSFSITFILLLGLLTSGYSQKFGYVDSAELLKEIEEWNQAQSILETFQLQMQKKGQGMVQTFQQNVAMFQEKQQAGDLSPRQAETEQERLMEDQKKIEEFEREMQTQIVKKQNELIGPILDKINAAIAKVAEEQGYDYVLDGSSLMGLVLYGDPAYNLQEAVKAAMAQ